jgi:hypothetical protein
MDLNYPTWSDVMTKNHGEMKSDAHSLSTCRDVSLNGDVRSDSRRYGAFWYNFSRRLCQFCEFHHCFPNILYWRRQITYRIFKRFEPDKPPLVGFLLIVIPALLIPALHSHIRNLTLAVGITFTSHYVLILVYVTIYRLSPFHPLAKYPGPMTNKLSKLTMSYISLTGKQHTYYRNLHSRYGNIVRTGKSWLVMHSHYRTDK